MARRTGFRFTWLAVATIRGTSAPIPAASRFSVASNSRSGYRIEFHPLGDFFESVSVAGLGNTVRLGADGGTIVQRGPQPPNLTHELSFRFMLRPGTLPGHYSWTTGRAIANMRRPMCLFWYHLQCLARGFGIALDNPSNGIACYPALLRG
jgi:hypothetical protein